MTENNPQQIVFIDSRVPDLQDLLNGLAPGEQAFVIDAASDGLQQIADILAANNLTDLSSISIVSHGESGALELGSSFVTDANLSSYSNTLAEIGAALAPGGNIQLYGCDVALGSGGQQFINEFSTLTGGAPVEAATHLVGAAALGGSWTLDAASTNGALLTGAPVGSPAASPAPAANLQVTNPFTSAALTAFDGVLAPSVVTELWMTAGVGSNNSTLEHADDTGSGTDANAVTLFHEFSTNYPNGLNQLTNVALDPTDGLYFLVQDGNGSTYGNAIYKGTLAPELSNPTGTPALTNIYSLSGSSSLIGEVSGIGLDTANQKVYFTEHQSLYEVGYNGGAVTTLTSTITNVFADGLALDVAHNQAFFFSHTIKTTTIGGHSSTGGHTAVHATIVSSNAIYVDSNLSAAGTAPTKLQLSPDDSNLHKTTAFSQNNFPVSLGLIAGIAVDTVTEKLYFTTTPSTNQVSHTTGTGGIYEYDLTGNPTGTYHAIWVEPSSGSLFLSYIQIDDATGKYYVTSDQSGSVNPSIYEGSLTGGTLAQTPTLFDNLTISTLTQTAEGFAIDNAPSLSITPVNSTFTESVNNPASSNNTPVSVISAATASDSDNSVVVSGTVSVGGFFAGDQLSFSTAGTSISGSYNSSTGVLTLSGNDSFAHYQTVFDSVHFTSTSENPTDYGSDTSRALSFTVFDGLVSSAAQTATVSVVGVNDPPTLTGTATAAFTEKAAAVALSPGATVFDPDSLDLGSATVAIVGGSFSADGDVLAANTAGTSITASYNSTTETLTLTGSDTLAHYQSVLDAVTYNSTSLNPTNYGSNTTRTVTWALNDGSGSFNLSTVQTSTVNITAVNDPPTLAGVASSVAFTEAQAVTLSPGLSVSDPDSLSFMGATVSISGGTFANDGDALATSATGTHITVSYNSATETLALSGSDTLANYQAVLDKVTFASGSNPDDYGSQKTRTITWVLNDGSGSNNLSTAASTTVSITAINDPPVLSAVATSASFTEGGSAATLSGALSVSDVDSLNLGSATVHITSGTFAGDGDVLAASTAGTSITASYNSTTETLTLTGSDTLAHYQTVLDDLTFTTANHNPTNYDSNTTRTVTWLLNDGSGSNNLSTVATTTLTITPVNDPPTLAGTANASFTEKGTSVALSTNLTVSDPDSLNLASATVAITGGTFSGDGDALAVDTTGTAITASYNVASETLVLSGSDTLADYQTVLDTVTFNSTSVNPTDYGSAATRTVTWTLNDGSASNASGTATSTVSITAVDDPPTLSGTANATFVEKAGAVTLSSVAAVSDPDSLNLASATVKITGGAFAGDVLAANVSGTSITASYNVATETLTLTGADTLANYQSVLDSATFNSSSLNPTDYGSDPTRNVTWTLNDGSGGTTTATSTVSITAVDDPPTLSGTTNATFVEKAGAVTLSSVAAVSDPDNLNLASATVKITGGAFAGDVLAANVSGTSITASYNSTTESLTLSGADTLAHYQSVIDLVTFNSTSLNPTDFGSDPTRTVTWTLNDGSGSTGTATSTVSITAVDDPPTLSGTANATFVEKAGTVALSSLAAVSDPDNLNLASATVKITGGAFAGDVLAANITGTSITASYNVATETLTLTGADTLAHYQSALDSVTFNSTSLNPTDYGSDPTRTVTWTLNDGSGSTTTATSTVSITAVDDPPTLTGTANASFVEKAGAVTLSSVAAVSDPDNLNLASATVKITGGAFVGDVLAANVSGTSITAAYNSTTESLTLTGADTLAHYQSVLDLVTFNSSSLNPTDFGSDTTRTVTWTLNDGSGSTGTATSTVSLTAVNDPPTLAGVNSAMNIPTAVATTLSPHVTVADPDNLTLASATVSVTGGTFTADGDVLGANVTGTSITASYNSTSETLTLSGSDTLAHYQQVLDSVTFDATGADPTNGGSNPTRTVSWVLNDGSGSSNTSAPQTTTVTIQPGPAIAAPVAVGFTEGGSITIAPTLAVSDVNSPTMVSATVSIVGGVFAGDGDVLAATGTASIAVSYDSTNEILTLTGTDTLTDYQAVLDSVTYTTPSHNPTDFGSAPTRTIAWLVNDGTATNNTGSATTTIDITPINDAPALSSVAPTAAFTERSTLALSPSASVSDVDSLDLASATVAVTGGTFAGDGDVLSAVTAGTSITASYNSATETLTLSGSDTVANYQQVLDSVSFSSGQNPDDYGSQPARTVTWVVDDGSGSNNISATQTTTVGITAINDPPTVAAAASAAFGLGQTISVSPALSVSDPDSLTLAGATVSITGGAFAGDGDVLGVNGSTSETIINGSNTITVAYNSASEMLTLTGSDTLADYQAVLDQVTFSSGTNPNNAGADPTRTVTWVADDGGATSNLSAPATTTINIAHIPPALSTAASASFAENSVTATSLSPSVTVTDIDSTSLSSATVSITGGTFAGDGDVLAATVLGNISQSYDSASETLTLTGSDSLANYQLVLDSVTFTTPSHNPTDFGSDPTRTVTWQINDGAASNATAVSTTTVSITATNDAPTLTVAANAAYTEGQTTAISPSLSVSDPDSLHLTGATVSVVGGTFAGDGDVLSATLTGTSITASYDSATEMLTLSGTDTLAHYQTVLDSVSFGSSSHNPTDFGSDPTRTVAWSITDLDETSGTNTNLSATGTTTVNITAVNDPPTLAGVAASVAFSIGNTVDLSPSLSVSDPDNLTLASATVAITGGTFAGDGDLLSATGTASIAVSYNSSTETLTLTGSDTFADYQSVLESIAFASGSNPNGNGADPTRTVSWVVDDGGASNHASAPVTSTIDIAHIAPSLTVASSANFTQGQTVTVSPALGVVDVDSAGLVGATVSIAGGTFVGDGDVLHVTIVGTSITASYNAATELLTLTGSDTLAHYQTVLDSVSFSSGSNPTNFGNNSTRAITWLVNDGSASNNLSSAATTTVSLTPLDQPPTLSHVAGSAAFTENGAAITLSSTLTVSDPDSANLTSATVSITGGAFTGDGDVLAATVVGNISASYNSSTETLVLTGTDTVAHYKTVLDSVTFVTPSQNPTDYGFDPTRTVTWVVADDFRIDGTPATTTINVTGVNNPPTLSVAPTASFVEGSTVALSPAASVSDPDSLDLASATVKITGGTFSGDGDVLAATVVGTHISASYDSASETLTLSGSDTLATYQSVLASVSFASNDNPDDFGSKPTRTVTWVLNDGSASSNTSSVATTTINVTAVNDPPALSNVPGTDSFTEGQTLTLAGTAHVTDPDNLDLASATVAITGGTFAGDGDVLGFSTAGTSVTASYNSASETLTLSGSDTLAHYQQVLDSVAFSSALNPDDYGSALTRTITWTLNDGSASNATDTVINLVSVTAVNNPPTLSNVAPSASYTERNAAVTLAGGLAVTDPDSLKLVGGTVAITGGTFALDGDSLAVTTTGTNITASYDSATETLTLSGTDTPADYQQVLDSLTFASTSHNPTDYGSAPTRTVTWSLNDGSASNAVGSATTTISITPVNDAPTLSGTVNTTFTEKGSAVTLSGAAAVSDPDNLDLAGATVKITGGTFAGDGDVLGANVAGTSITASYNAATETLTLTGSDTLADYSQVLDSITFNSTSLNPTDYGSAPTRTVAWTLNDGSASNALGTATTTISITPVNDPPTLSGTANAAFVEKAGAVTLSGSASVSDPDNINLASATVAVTSGAFVGDVLAASTAGTSITASYNSATETLILTGADTVADYKSVLDSVTFNSTSLNPTDYGSDLARTVAWTVNDGSASNATAVATTTIGVTGVNDPPTLTSVAALVSFHIGRTITVSPNLSVTDPDSLTLANATVKITGGTFTGDGDVLAANTAGTGIVALYNSTTETLTLSGSDTPANYQHVLDSVTFSAGINPANSNSNLNPSRTLTWEVNDGAGSNNLSSVATTTITVQPTIKNDFNSDQVSDILLQDTPPTGGRGGGGGDINAGSAEIYLVNGTSIGSPTVLPKPGTGWNLAATGDFNADGNADIVWQNTNGTPMIWTMNGTSVTSQTTLSDPGSSWKIIGTADFNNDGNTDILFQNSDGTPMIWTMNGTSVAATATLTDPGSAWKAIGTGDFNGDGKAEILFQNSNGTPMIWTMNGSSVAATATLSDPGSNWRAVGTGDFNGDGKSDILFQNGDSTAMIWEMNGTSVAVSATLTGPGSGWKAVGTSDFNGDGKSDILFQNTNGTPMIWTMNGTTVAAQTTLTDPGLNWHANTG
ncbi:MAG TPA: DUF4347 domain-containing protein [Xanthobacteraceae bacterium]